MSPRSFRENRRPVVVAVALATGLTLGWLPTVSLAQQSPDGWSDDHRAVLRSGLTIDLDFQTVPGVTARAGEGTLDGTAGTGSRRAPAFADGVRAGAPAQTFELTQDRPQADGAWRTMGSLQLTFSRPVRNPRLHVSGLAGLATGAGGKTASAVRLTVIGGTPAGPALTSRSPWAGWSTAGGALAPATADGSGDGAADQAGSLELDGTFDTATFRVEQRSTAYAGSSTAPVKLHLAYTVTLDEAVGSAPQGYGNASHLISDLFLGADAAGVTPAHIRGTASTPEPSPAPPENQPGRLEHLANDPTVVFPREAAIGRYYDVTVPVNPGLSPATLVGWIDFDRNGHFDATERAQVEVAPGATAATLEWTVPPNVSAGDTWARLRIARDPSQLVAPSGFADSGQVEDQAVQLAVGAAKPELTSPVAGAAVGDARPEFRGDSGVAGATVEVQEGAVTLCQATVSGDGTWSCRPGAPLAQGAHTVLPAETTSGGVVLHGEPVRITVTTTPPPVPAFTLPAYTNDPGLLLTGTGGPGTTVMVTDQGGAELCGTTVRQDRTWSCLPVEELAEGTHVLTATAVDPAGNRTAGRPTTLIVDTVPPGKPVITSPGAGEQVSVVRPRLAGTAEPGTTVTVVSSKVDGALCGAVAAVDGHWTCTPVRDLAAGEQLLTATATDRAGNATAGEAVRVRLSAPTASPTPTPTPTPTPAPTPSAAPVPAVPSASGTAPGVAPVPVLVPIPVPAVPVTSAPPTSGPVLAPTPSSVSSSVSSSLRPTSAPSTSASPSRRAAVAPDAPSGEPAANAVPAADIGDGDRTPLGPPDAMAPVRHTSFEGWRAASGGALLILTGMTLLTRRILARGPGSRRR